MNQRIFELVDKAISDVDYIRDDDFTNEELSKMYIPDCFAEKFAELIVRECLILVNERQQRAPSDDDGYFKTALDMVSTDIEQHFGVEE